MTFYDKYWSFFYILLSALFFWNKVKNIQPWYKQIVANYIFLVGLPFIFSTATIYLLLNIVYLPLKLWLMFFLLGIAHAINLHLTKTK